MYSNINVEKLVNVLYFKYILMLKIIRFSNNLPALQMMCILLNWDKKLT